MMNKSGWMTNEEKKEYLSRYTLLEQQILRRLEESNRLHLMKEKAGILPSLWGKGPSATERLNQAEQMISRELEDYLALRRQIVEAVSAVRGSTLQLLLEYRYLDGCTWEQIAEKMHYSTMQIYRLHQKALDQVNFPTSRTAG